MNSNIKAKERHIKEYLVSQTLKYFTEEHLKDEHWTPVPSFFTIFPCTQGLDFRKVTLMQAVDKRVS